MSQLGSFADEYRKHLQRSKRDLRDSRSSHNEVAGGEEEETDRPSVVLEEQEKPKVKQVPLLERRGLDLKALIKQECAQEIEKLSYQKKTELELKTLDLTDKQDVQFLVELIRKPLKRKGELACLTKFLIEIPFFRKVSDNVSSQAFVSLVKRISYEFVPKHSPLFRQGDFGTKYYVILQGQVAVLGYKAGINPNISTNNQLRVASPLVSGEESAKLKDFSKSPLHPHSSSDKRRRFRETPSNSQTFRRGFSRTNSIVAADQTSRRGTKTKIILPENESRDHTPSSPSTKRNSDNFVTPRMTPSSRHSVVPQRHADQMNKGSPLLGQQGGGGGGNKVSLFGRLNVPQAQSMRRSPRGGFDYQSSESSARKDLLPSGRPQTVIQQQQHSEHEESGEATNTSQDLFEEMVEYSFPTEKFLKSLEAGVGFGELALLGNARRTATVVTMKDTHLAVLDKATYDEILKDFHESMYKEKINFLRNTTLFSDWSGMKIAALLMIFEIKTLPWNHVLYSRNEEAEHVYLIRSGEVELIETITIEEKSRRGKVGQNELNSLCIPKRFSHKTQMKKVMFRVGAGSIFGEEEIFEQVKRKYTAVVSSQKAELFIVEKKKFIDSLKGSQAYEKLLEQYQTKKNWRTGFKNHINQSIVEKEEKKKDQAPTNPDEKARLTEQHEQINPRLVVKRIPSHKAESFRIHTNDVSVLQSSTLMTSTFWAQSPKTKEHIEQPASPSVKAKEEFVAAHLTRSELENNVSTTSSILGKAQISLRKLIQQQNSVFSPKAATNLSGAQSPKFSDGSPKLTSNLMAKSALFPVTKHFENDSLKLSPNIKIESQDQTPVGSRGRRVTESTESYSFMSGQQLTRMRPAIPGRLTHPDRTKTPSSIDKSKLSLYSRISKLNDILGTSPTQTKTPVYCLDVSRGWTLAESALQSNKSVTTGTYYDIDRGSAVMVDISKGEGTAINNLFNQSATQFPFQITSPKVNRSFKQNFPQKEVVNIHVQRLNEKQGHKMKGRMTRPSVTQGQKKKPDMSVSPRKPNFFVDSRVHLSKNDSIV